MKWPMHIRIFVILVPGLFMALAGCAGAPVNKTLFNISYLKTSRDRMMPQQGHSADISA